MSEKPKCPICGQQIFEVDLDTDKPLDYCSYECELKDRDFDDMVKRGYEKDE